MPIGGLMNQKTEALNTINEAKTVAVNAKALVNEARAVLPGGSGGAGNNNGIANGESRGLGEIASDAMELVGQAANVKRNAQNILGRGN